MTESDDGARRWRVGERVVFGVGLVLLIGSVLGVMGGIASASGRDQGLENLFVTSVSVLIAVGVGVVAGAVIRASTNMRRARGVVVEPL